MSSTNPFKGRVIQTEAPMRVIRRFTKRGGYPYRLLDGHRRSNAKTPARTSRRCGTPSLMSTWGTWLSTEGLSSCCRRGRGGPDHDPLL